MDMRTQLQEDMKTALRARAEGKLRLSVLRMVWSDVTNAEIDAHGALDDAAVTQLISRAVRQRLETIAEAEKAGREDVIAQTRAEIAILQGYLPEPLSPEELAQEVERAIRETAVTSVREIGKVMAVLLPRVRGRADGRTVQAAVRQQLGGS